MPLKTTPKQVIKLASIMVEMEAAGLARKFIVAAFELGIPQPSLSRMLNSSSMPRRSTLYRIAIALDLPESESVSEWSR